MSKGLSEYEQLRMRNILRNEAEMRRLGLDVSALTNKALGRFAPSKATSRRALRLPGAEPTRRSERIAGIEATAVVGDLLEDFEGDEPRRKKVKMSARPQPSNASSCRVLRTRSVEELRESVGEEIPAIGGTQAKRGAMEWVAEKGTTPTFSRMSGIQEWQNAICLFVNVYGDGYKNVFLHAGEEITWFAQPRQWEGSPVIQRLINCAGGHLQTDDGDTEYIDETPVFLFCREEGRPYVFCGSLSYLAHDPTRLPVRFLWHLDDFQHLQHKPNFTSLLTACNAILTNDTVAPAA